MSYCSPKGVLFVPRLFPRCPGKILSMALSLTPGAQEKSSFEREETPSGRRKQKQER